MLLRTHPRKQVPITAHFTDEKIEVENGRDSLTARMCWSWDSKPALSHTKAYYGPTHCTMLVYGGLVRREEWGVRGRQPSSLFRGWESSLRLSCALHMSRYSPALSVGQSGPHGHNSSGFLLTCPTLSPLPAASFLLPFQHLKNLSCPLFHSHSSMGREKRDTVVKARDQTPVLSLNSCAALGECLTPL